MRRRNVLLAVRRSQTRNGYVSDLSQNGFEVVTANHGLECLDVLRWFPPDVVVIEPELLWGGGDGVLALMSEINDLRNLPVFVLTTDRNRAAMYSISQFPVSDFWAQPVSAKSLTARILRAQGDQWPHRSARIIKRETSGQIPPNRPESPLNALLPANTS